MMTPRVTAMPAVPRVAAGMCMRTSAQADSSAACPALPAPSWRPGAANFGRPANPAPCPPAAKGLALGRWVRLADSGH